MVSLNEDFLHHKMTPQRMLDVIQSCGEEVAEQGNVVDFSFRGVPITLVYDTNADRMRLISPIKQRNELILEQVEAAMLANFHTTLDVRYCFYNDVVWSAFLHPLSELSVPQLTSAIEQVAVANLTFGSDYSSGDLFFQG